MKILPQYTEVTSESKVTKAIVAYEDIRLLPNQVITRELMTASVDGIYDDEGEIAPSEGTDDIDFEGGKQSPTNEQLQTVTAMMAGTNGQLPIQTAQKESEDY